MVEEEDKIVVPQLDLGELDVDNRGAGEVRGGLGDHCLGHLDVVIPSPGLGGGGAPRALAS